MLNKIPTNVNEYYIYIMASKSGTLYTGQTDNIVSRVYEHKNKIIEGFTKKYNCNRLVYYEIYKTRTEALQRETQIKSYNRQKKQELIKLINPEWKDLASDWYNDLNVILPFIHRKGIPRRSSSGL
ncbi:MAG TPA: hypothetical protein DEB09_04800 [Candidatus Magasanikbacteria bacterium]|nr:hypothetical protein [Candidatus Magasanikbacteria bacterium]